MRTNAPGFFAAGIIVMLMLGYIPLSSIRPEDVTAEYSLRVLQYDERGGKAAEPRLVDVVELDGGRAVVFRGMALDARYTELKLDLMGPRARRLVCEGVISGDPSQLWLQAIGPNRAVLREPLVLEGLEEGWSPTVWGEMTLWQRQADFADPASFLEYLAGGGGPVGVAGCEPGEVMAAALAGRKSGQATEQLDLPLRGPHNLRLISGGDLKLEVSKRDLNLYEGSDSVAVKIYRGDELVLADLLEDDGETGRAGVSETTQVRSFDLRGLGPGLYRVEIGSAQGGSDYILTSVRTDAPGAVFTDRLFTYEPREVAEGNGGAVARASCYIHSPGGNLTCSTWHPCVSRSVEVEGGPRVELERSDLLTQVKGSAFLPRGEKELVLSMPCSLILEMGGAGFSFRREALFDPNLAMLQPLWSGSVHDYDRILTRGYQALEKVPGWRRFRLEFELDRLGSNGSGLRLILEKIGGEAFVRELKVRLE